MPPRESPVTLPASLSLRESVVEQYSGQWAPGWFEWSDLVPGDPCQDERVSGDQSLEFVGAGSLGEDDATAAGNFRAGYEEGPVLEILFGPVAVLFEVFLDFRDRSSVSDGEDERYRPVGYGVLMLNHFRCVVFTREQGEGGLSQSYVRLVGACLVRQGRISDRQEASLVRPRGRQVTCRRNRSIRGMGFDSDHGR